jgi:hypothetical protein
MLQRRVETSLNDDDKEQIRHLLTSQGDLWDVIVKYLYDKANIQTRKLMNCKPEELAILQDKAKTYLEMIHDFGVIKNERLKKESLVKKTIDKGKDIWDYISGQDTNKFKIIKK